MESAPADPQCIFSFVVRIWKLFLCSSTCIVFCTSQRAMAHYCVPAITSVRSAGSGGLYCVGALLRPVRPRPSRSVDRSFLMRPPKAGEMSANAERSRTGVRETFNTMPLEGHSCDHLPCQARPQSCFHALSLFLLPLCCPPN